MGIKARKQVRLGPVRLHFTQQGFSSWSVRLGPWSWNSRRRAHRVDLPGPWHWQGESRRTRRRSRRDAQAAP